MQLEALHSYNIFQTVWKTGRPPVEWQESKVIQLFKKSGSLNDLSSYHHLHTHDEFCKLFTQIVISDAKVNLLKKYADQDIDPANISMC